GTKAGRRPHSHHRRQTCGPTTRARPGSSSIPRRIPPNATTSPSNIRTSSESSVNLWWVEAGKYNALRLENRGVVEILGTERPQIAKQRSRYLYYPGDG